MTLARFYKGNNKSPAVLGHLMEASSQRPIWRWRCVDDKNKMAACVTRGDEAVYLPVLPRKAAAHCTSEKPSAFAVRGVSRSAEQPCGTRGFLPSLNSLRPERSLFTVRSSPEVKFD